ncbi:gamma-glutamylcyclotransferase family protein [Paraburkholderia sp. 2C]|jgi:gamma-glutamylcyclotransferase (GGCT)/AIG2-like uncharacterized protein YtfP
MKAIRLFVYGTLMRGHRQDLSCYEPVPVYLGEGWVAGRLYDLGHCPALVLDHAAAPVWGEVWSVPRELFEALNHYEMECGDFQLRQAPVFFEGALAQMALYEIGARQRLPSTQLAGGRWLPSRPVAMNERPNRAAHRGDGSA